MNNLGKKIVVIGATGLIGRSLIPFLVNSGYRVIALSRSIQKARAIFNDEIDVEYWNGLDSLALIPILNDAYAVINLAGESIAVRWTKKIKERLYNSRIDTTISIVDAINSCTNPPKVLIQASAIGYYSYNSDIQCYETSAKGGGFLSNLVSEWENAAKKVNSNCRLVLIRTGIVLSSNGGFLEKLINPTRFYLGGWFGDGLQKISWIHIDDYVNAVKFLIEEEKCTGPFNMVSPKPVTLKHFAKGVGNTLKRPVWLPIPKFVLRLFLGKMADEVIFSNQNVIPQKLLSMGYVYNHHELKEALDDLLKQK